jgi:hypothetical protein
VGGDQLVAARHVGRGQDAPDLLKRHVQLAESPDDLGGRDLLRGVAAVPGELVDVRAIVATFAEDAYVNDARREFVGTEAIRRWVAKEMVRDKVRTDVREVLDHHGDTIVRGAYEGEFDKTNLPDELILSNYFSVRDGKIVSLVVIFNQPAAY